MSTTATPALPLKIKLFFSLGWPAEYIVLRSLELFVLFYYTQVLGLPGFLAGIALFIAMLFDAFADPAIGAFSDNLRKSRFGRRHTLMFLAPIPLGLALTAVFLPPSGMGQWALFAWLTATTVAVRFLCGLYVVPYSAQLAEMTRDPGQRASLSVYKSVAQTVFDFAMLAMAFDVFFARQSDGISGQMNAAAYLPFAATLAAALVVTTLVSAFGTYRYMRSIERAGEASAPKAAPTPLKFSFSGVRAAWKRVLFDNPNVRAILIGALLSSIATSVARSLTSHLGVFFWELQPQQIGYWQKAAIPGLFLGMFIARFCAKRTELISMIKIGLVLMFTTLALPPLLKLLGLLPSGSAYPLLLGSNFVMGTGSGMLMLVAGLVCAEAADEEEFRLGLPQQGFLFGFVFLATKMGSALGKLVSGTALDVIGFPLRAASTDPQVVRNLAWTLIGSVLVLGTCSYLFWSRFRLPKQRHAEIISTINARQSQAAPTPA